MSSLASVVLAGLVWLMPAPTAQPALAQPVSAATNAVWQLEQQLNTTFTSVVELTAGSDPDQLLGFPGQYVAKTTFLNPRGDTGSVEVFATATDAQSSWQSLSPTSQDAVTPNGRYLLNLTSTDSGMRSAYQSAFKLLTLT
jgi:hypothetical protein